MTGFSTEADLRTALDSQRLLIQSWRKTQGNSSNTGNWCGSWVTGQIPAAGSAPASTPGTSYSSTAGGIVFPDTSSVGKFLLSFSVKQDSVNAAFTWGLWDRLVGVGSIAVNSTGAKTVNSTALPRYTGTDSVGVQVWIEIATAGTTTTPAVSLTSYTDQNGNTGSVGGQLTFPGATTAAQTLIGPFPLAAGDTGVRSVETVTVDTAGGGSGVINILLVKPIVHVGGAFPGGFERRSPYPFRDFPRIFDGFTGMIVSKENGTGTATGYGEVTVVLG